MSSIKVMLFEALKQAKAEELKTRNTAMPKEIAAVINKHFKNKETLKEVQSILKNRLKQESSPSNYSQWQDWEGPGSKKRKNVAKDSILEEAVVDETNDDDNDALFSDFWKMNNQQILDKFGTLNKVKAFVKELGLAIDPKLKPEDYLDGFRFELKKLSDEEE